MEVGQPCSFYHEGGRGDAHWVRGWRYGFIVAAPTRGAKKNWMQIEVRVPRYNRDELTGKYVLKPFERAWVPAANVNEPGDTRFHGQRLVEVVKERKAAKRV